MIPPPELLAVKVLATGKQMISLIAAVARRKKDRLCAEKYIVVARIGRFRREQELLRRHALWGERGEFDGGWALDPGVRKTAFPQANSHATVVCH